MRLARGVRHAGGVETGGAVDEPLSNWHMVLR